MTRAIGSGTGLVAAALLLLGVVGSAGAGPPSVLGVPCSEISAHHLDMQTNVRAYLVVKGCAALGTKPEPAPTESVPSATSLALATQVGGTDRDVISPQDTVGPHDTQAGSMVAAKGNTIVVDYNDSRNLPGDYSGASISTDAGTSWTRIDPFATGHSSNFGDPLLVYNRRFATFIAGDLAAGCGGFGIGTWTSANGQSWAPGPCVHSGTQDDRPSIAVDNDPTSPFYGNTYVSWNDFNIGGGALVSSRSVDGGATWSPEQIISATFIRNTQLAVQPVNGQVDLVGVDEGGGGLNPRTNNFFRSQDGGVTWSSPISMGPAFPAAGDTVNGYFAGFHHIWRAMGWGNPVPGGPTTIVYPYYRAGGGGDTGDVYAVRSIDNGATWSAPIAISTALHEQWFSQAVSNGHSDLAIWYYSRENTTDGNNYEIYLSQSHDGGATWTSERRLSNVLIDEPAQNDPNVNPFFAGDYNVTTSDVNGAALAKRLLITWTDGRNKVATSPGNYDFTATTGTIGSGGTDVGNHCDDCSTAVSLPFPVTFYGTSYTTVNVASNGLIGFGAATNTFANPCLPSGDGVSKIAPYWDDLTTQNPGFGWFSTTAGTAPHRVFTLREDAQLFNSATEVHFEARLHEGSTRFEIVYGTLGSDGSSATAGVETGSGAKQIECNSPGVLASTLEETAVFNPNETSSIHTEDVEFDQVPLSARITVRKVLVPTSDSGLFNLLVGSTVVASAVGNGGSGTATVGPGTFTVKETAASGSLADYATSIACTKNGVADVSGSGTSIAVTVAGDDVEVCRITNKRKATITLRKALSPTSDTGTFNLIAGTKTLASGVGNGGSGSSSFAPTSYTLRESAGSGTTLSNYTSSIACTRNGGSGPSGNGTSLTVSVAPADVLDCTFTNVRKAKITVTKSLSPTSDPGLFNLLVGSTTVKSNAGNGGSGSTLVIPGGYTVSEAAASGTSLSNYTSSIVCTKNGLSDASGSGTSLAVSVAAGDVEACTITNVRK